MGAEVRLAPPLDVAASLELLRRAGDDGIDRLGRLDPGAGEDFYSSQIRSVQFDDSLGTVTITGDGVSNGLPVLFLIVEQAATATTPAVYSISLSDGYALAGNLLTGAIQLQ